jgi:hypothetical protein
MGRHHAAGATRGRDAMLASLSLAAGCVDAVGYLGHCRVFVANMTGNYVLLGLAIGQADGRDVLQSGTMVGRRTIWWLPSARLPQEGARLVPGWRFFGQGITVRRPASAAPVGMATPWQRDDRLIALGPTAPKFFELSTQAGLARAPRSSSGLLA